MKAKDLKALLNGTNDDALILIEDVNGNCLDVVSWCNVKDNNYDAVYLCTRQEFPDAWFDDGREVRWINGVGVLPVVPDADVEELEICDVNVVGGDPVVVSLKFDDGIAEGDGVVMKYPKLSELTDEQIAAIDEYCGGRITDSKCVTPYDVCLLYGKVASFGIMDACNGHDANLVREINLKWVKHRDHFKPILCALYERDIDEITDADSFQIPAWTCTQPYIKGERTGDWSEYNRFALECMQMRWDEFAENYMMHIADDQDLCAVLAFVRCDVCEDGKKTH